MAEVVAFPAQDELLLTVSLYKKAGRISAVIDHMPNRVIERTGNEVSDRLRIIAGWMDAARASLLAQANALDTVPNDGEINNG